MLWSGKMVKTELPDDGIHAPLGIEVLNRKSFVKAENGPLSG